MAKFIYRFDSIQKTKEILEKKIQKELAEIDKQLELRREECLSLELKREQSSEIIEQCKKVSELKLLDNYKNELEKQVEIIKQSITLLTKQRENKICELIKRSKENKMFKLLEETHLQEFIHEENAKEENIVNELAAQKFNRENS